MNDLNILGLTDAEKVAFLLRERDLMVKWIKRQKKKHEDDRKPMPAEPLDFSLSTPEEKAEVEGAIWSHNWHCDAVSGAYSYLLTAIEVGRKRMVAELHKEKFPGDNYSI